MSLENASHLKRIFILIYARYLYTTQCTLLTKLDNMYLVVRKIFILREKQLTTTPTSGTEVIPAISEVTHDIKLHELTCIT